MIELETRSGSENDKHNKQHKYTLDEAFQAVLEFNDETGPSEPGGAKGGLDPPTFCLLMFFLLLAILKKP